MWRVLVAVAAACAGCGDNVPRDVAFEPTAGTRLLLERYLYDDGTTLPSPAGFFDGDLHVRCTPQLWGDGVLRCVPDAEDALFTDATCTTVIGRAQMIMKPRAFIGREIVGGQSRALHVYRADQPTAAPTSYYQRIDGTCTGPFSTPSDPVYYTVTEVGPPVELGETTVGEGRVELRVQTSVDGAVVPLAFHDRDLAIDCQPTQLADGSAVCEPIGAPVATLFADAACTQPVLPVGITVTPPRVALLASDPSGATCPRFATVGAEVTGNLYRLFGTTCSTLSPTPSFRYFLATTPATPAPVTRTVDHSPRRLHRIEIGDGALISTSDRLLDTTTDTECARVTFGDVERCIPTSTLSPQPLFAQGCFVQLLAAAVPVEPCAGPASFAFSSASGQFAMHAIGGVASVFPYHVADNGSCQPFTPPADQEVRTLSAALPPETFVAARPYGERTFP